VGRLQDERLIVAGSASGESEFINEHEGDA
jgi:hypothetical protein